MILYGASGHAKVIIEILEASGEQAITLWDDVVKPPLWQYPVVLPGTVDGREEMIVSVGINRVRRDIADRYAGQVHFGRAVHPRSTVSPRAAIGEGSVVMAGVSINADTTIGRHCIINTNASVDHDCRIGDYVHVSPNASLCGGVRVEEGAHIGAGATLIPGVQVGKWSTVGAGAVVIQQVPDYATVVGNPARIIKYNKPALQDEQA